MSKMKIFVSVILAVCFTMLFASCVLKGINKENLNAGEKRQDKDNYAPEQGKIYLFAGQDLGAVGGLKEYTEGYVDYVGMPAGITTYTGIHNLGGLYGPDNWGSGDVCAQYYLDDERFDDVMIAIGLFLGSDLKSIVDGGRDDSIKKLGEWIKKAHRPVFLRIGYEFEGKWNSYDPGMYKKSFKYIVDKLNEMEAGSFVTVWQSSGYRDDDIEYLMDWYPGDDYVDWLGFSYFDHDIEKVGSGLLKMAREKNKPVMIAEATPKGFEIEYGDGEEIWEKWFAPFFRYVKLNSDVIKAVSYINVNWQLQPMWKNNGWGDSRVFAHPFIYGRWKKEMKEDIWIHREFAGYKEFIRSEKPVEDESIILPEDFVAQGVTEAETARVMGNVRAYDDAAASSGRGLAYIMSEGDKFWFEDVKAADKLTFRYASTFSGTLGIYVNGERTADFNFTATDSWTGSYNEITVFVDIPEGAKLEVKYDSGDSAANIDYIKFD